MTPPKAHGVRATNGEKAAAARSLLIEDATELLTLRGPPEPRVRETAADLGIVEDGAVYVEGDRIVDVGAASEVRSRHPRADVRIDATGRVVMPGFVDPHTHAIFAGSREHEVEWKAQGLGYAEIAARGGGILSTVRATREASEDALVRTGSERMRSMLSAGTTTLEVKTGYGLRTDDEVRMLRASARAASLAGVDVVPTFLGAHAITHE